MALPGPATRATHGPDNLGNRLRRMGIEPRAARNTTLLQLGAELPSIVLADLLGVISAPPNAGTPPQVPAGAATPPDQPRLRRKRHERRTRESGTSSTRMALPSSAPQWPEVSRALIVQRPDRVSGHRVRLHTADDLLRDTLGALHLGFRSL